MTDRLPGALTLDQLRVFLAAADEGSFSAAGRRLGRAQSAISYGVANLERLLGVTLFDRTGRRPVLSPAGSALLPDARSVTARAEQLVARARAMHAGIESTVALAVDALFPTAPLLATLARFDEVFPTVALRLRTEALGAVVQVVLDGACDVGVSLFSQTPSHGLRRRLIATVPLIHVAAPTHPLVGRPAPIADEDLHDHIQIVLTDRSRRSAGVDHGVLSARTWRVADLGTKRELLLAGLGWGSMPEHSVAADLASGALRRLEPARLAGDPVQVSIAAITPVDRDPGPATRWLIDELAAACAGGRSAT